MEKKSVRTKFHFKRMVETFENLKKKLEVHAKKLKAKLKNTAGRSNGRIVSPRRNNYKKRKQRPTDYKRISFPKVLGTIIGFIKNPNGTSVDSGVNLYIQGAFNYIIRALKLEEGDRISNLAETPSTYGDSGMLSDIPSGRLIHNIAGKYTKSSGCSTVLIRKDNEYALIKLKSGEIRYIPLTTIATLGTVSNEDRFLRNLRKAGTVRYHGFRPRTRPCSMNPVDHPLGGRTRGGSQPKDKKGRISIHIKTVKRINPLILYTKRKLKIMRL